MFDITNTYASFNLIELGLLKDNWFDQIKYVAENYSYYTKLDGKSSTSREPADTLGAEVFVVEGDTIADKLPWLHNLYQKEFLDFANSNFKGKYDFAKNIKSGTNINLLKGKMQGMNGTLIVTH